MSFWKKYFCCNSDYQYRQEQNQQNQENELQCIENYDNQKEFVKRKSNVNCDVNKLPTFDRNQLYGGAWPEQENGKEQKVKKELLNSANHIEHLKKENKQLRDINSNLKNEMVKNNLKDKIENNNDPKAQALALDKLKSPRNNQNNSNALEKQNQSNNNVIVELELESQVHQQNMLRNKFHKSLNLNKSLMDDISKLEGMIIQLDRNDTDEGNLNQLEDLQDVYEKYACEYTRTIEKTKTQEVSVTKNDTTYKKRESITDKENVSKKLFQSQSPDKVATRKHNKNDSNSLTTKTEIQQQRDEYNSSDEPNKYGNSKKHYENITLGNVKF